MKRNLLLTMTFSALATVAMAQSQVAFEALDTDEDGLLTAEEAGAELGLSEQFSELDTDNDNMLSHAEYDAFLNTDMTEATAWKEGGGPDPRIDPEELDRREFSMFDTNQDGRISRMEINAFYDTNWEAMDTNKDQDIDDIEFAAWKNKGRQIPSEVDDSAMGDDYAANYQRLDVNQDGYLTSDEMQDYQGIDAYWANLDTNKDGNLDLNEYTAMWSDQALIEKTGWKSMGPASKPTN